MPDLFTYETYHPGDAAYERAKPGHELVESVSDLHEPRRNLLRLAAKGKRIARTLLELMNS